MSKRMKLESLKVQSFVTTLGEKEESKIKGGLDTRVELCPTETCPYKPTIQPWLTICGATGYYCE